jgi:hypothetical protein
MYLLLAFGFLTDGNAVCCSERRQAPGNPTLEKQELHTKVMIDFFVCFLFGNSRTQARPPQHTLQGTTGTVFLLSDTWISQPQPSLVLPFGRRRKGCELCRCNPEIRGPVAGACVAVESWELLKERGSHRDPRPCLLATINIHRATLRQIRAVGMNY